jgi:hypothetical protein
MFFVNKLKKTMADVSEEEFHFGVVFFGVADEAAGAGEAEAEAEGEGVEHQEQEEKEQEEEVQQRLFPFQEHELREMDRLENISTGEIVTTFGWLANPSRTGKAVTMAAYLNTRGTLRVPYTEKTFSHVRSTERLTNLLVQKTRTYNMPFNPEQLPETVATLWVCTSFELNRIRKALRTFAPDIRFTVLRRLTDVKRLINVTSTSFSEDHIVDFVERRGLSVVVVLDGFLTNYRRVFQRVAWNRIVASNLFRNKVILNAFSSDAFVRRFFWVLQSVPEAHCADHISNIVSRVTTPGARLGSFDALQKSGTLSSVMIRTANLLIKHELHMVFVHVKNEPSATNVVEEKCVQQRADNILHKMIDGAGTSYRFATKRAWLIDEARRSLDFLDTRGMQTVDDVVDFLVRDVQACIAALPPEVAPTYQGKLARLQRPKTEPHECPVCLMVEEHPEEPGGAEGESAGAGGGSEVVSEAILGKKFVTIRSCHHKLCSTCCAILVSRTSPTVCPSCRQDFNAMHVLVSTKDVLSEAVSVDALRQAEIESFGRLESRQDRIVRAVREILATHPDANVVVTVENIEQTRHNMIYELPFSDEELERVWTVGLCDTSFMLDANMSVPPGINLCDVTHVVTCFEVHDPLGFQWVLTDFCLGFEKTVRVVEIV